MNNLPGLRLQIGSFVKRYILVILMIMCVILLFSTYLNFLAHVTVIVEHRQSGMHIYTEKNLIGNVYNQSLFELVQLKYSGVQEIDVDSKSCSFSNLLKQKAPVFLPDFKNPCWYDVDDNDRRQQWTEYMCNKMKGNTKLCKLYSGDKRPTNISVLRCLPYFMLIGQAKCGTTDLFESIMKHPDVKKGFSKEPHWWANSRHCSSDAPANYPIEHPRSFTEYLDYFNPAAEILELANDAQRRRIITGEGSALTLWNNKWWWWYPENKNDKEPGLLTAHFVRHILPSVKLLVILRNPVDRLFSSYLYFVNGNKSVEAFHRKVTSLINTFKRCRATGSLRHCTYHGSTNYLSAGIYALYLKDWMDIFPRNQLLIISLDEYSTKPSMTKSKVYKFLELRGIGRIRTSANHYNNRRRSTRSVGPMLNETRHILEDFYKPFNKALALLLNDKTFLWKT